MSTLMADADTCRLFFGSDVYVPGVNADDVDVSFSDAQVYKPLYREPWRYAGLYGGRAAGRSYAAAHFVLGRCLREPGLRVACLREVQRSLEQSSKQLLTAEIAKYKLDDYFVVQRDRIITPGGGVIIFNGLQDHTADSIKSLEGIDVAWVEEAHSITHVSLSLLRPTIRKPKSQLIFTWNPRFEEDAIDSLLRGDTPPEDTLLISSTYLDNPFLSNEIGHEVKDDKKRDYETYRHVWLGEYRKMTEGAVYRNWRIEDFQEALGVEMRIGLDFGFSESKTACIKCYFFGKILYITHEAVYKHCPIDMLPALLKTIPDADRWPIVADSSRPETIDYLRTHGYPLVVPSKKGSGSVFDGISYLQGKDIIVHPRCKETIRELQLYSYKIDKRTGKPLPLILKTNDDCMDAIRYACETAIQMDGAYSDNKQVFIDDRTAASWA